MKPTDFDWGDGRIDFWEMDGFDSSKPLVGQATRFLAGEDLAQVVFRNGRLIDIGWYSSLGSFVVLVIARPRPVAWDRPLFRRCARTLRGFRIAVRLAVKTAEGGKGARHKASRPSGDDLRPEYRFDYAKSQPNRFAASRLRDAVAITGTSRRRKP